MSQPRDPQCLHGFRRYGLSLIGDDGCSKGTRIAADRRANALGDGGTQAIKPHVGHLQPTLGPKVRRRHRLGRLVKKACRTDAPEIR